MRKRTTIRPSDFSQVRSVEYRDVYEKCDPRDISWPAVVVIDGNYYRLIKRIEVAWEIEK